jgi:hypothetical protein
MAHVYLKKIAWNEWVCACEEEKNHLKAGQTTKRLLWKNILKKNYFKKGQTKRDYEKKNFFLLKKDIHNENNKIKKFRGQTSQRLWK